MLYILCLCYLDDIVVFANSPEHLIKRLDAVFSRLRQYGLKAKPSKCVFFKSPIEFLDTWFLPTVLNLNQLSLIPSEIGLLRTKE